MPPLERGIELQLMGILLLAAFAGLHLLVQRVGSQVRTCLVERLSPVQRYILELLHLSPSCMTSPARSRWRRRVGEDEAKS